MSLSVGIVGLPNAGKSTLFKCLTQNKVEIQPYAFTTIEPNMGVVAVPDSRLKKVAQICNPQKVTPASIKFIDIAGLVKQAHKGEGLGNQFLAKIRECQAIVEVVRGFKDDQVEHVEKSIDPPRDAQIIKTELLMKDSQTAKKLLDKLESKRTDSKTEKKKVDLLQRIRKALNQEKKISQLPLTEKENHLIKSYQFLTAKPTIYLLNINQESKESVSSPVPQALKIDLKLEQEILELTSKEQKELKMQSNLDQLIKACYNILNLITFYTVAGQKEVRAWSLKQGSGILQAAQKVHSDFREKFIRAQVIGWKELIKLNSWKKAKDLGELNTVGKEYGVQDGDVIEFKI